MYLYDYNDLFFNLSRVLLCVSGKPSEQIDINYRSKSNRQAKESVFYNLNNKNHYQ